MLDVNDAAPRRAVGLIPDGTYLRLKLQIRPGGYTLQNMDPIDERLFTASKRSDAIMLDCEYTVISGPHARHKVWQYMTVAGGQVDEKGVSKAWNITKTTVKAMIDSAVGLDPNDQSEATQVKRRMRGFRDLDGIEFVVNIGVEHSEGYGPKNKIAFIVTPDRKEWKEIVEGREIPPNPTSPTGPRNAPSTSSQKPAWQAAASPAAPAGGGPAPAWGRDTHAEWRAMNTPPSGAATPTAEATTPPVAPSATQPQQGGPAWLRG